MDAFPDGRLRPGTRLRSGVRADFKEIIKMKNRFKTAMIALAAVALSACTLGRTESAVKDYRGANPVGDYIGVTVDMSARLVSFHNYTLNANYGPYGFSKITDPARNLGFNIIYETGEIVEYPAPGCYARFAIMDGVTLIYQLMNYNGTPEDRSDDTTEGYPSYAFMYATSDIGSCKGTAYTFMEYRMGNGDDRFAAGLGAFDTDAAGTLYQAAYNSAADARDEAGHEDGMEGTASPDANRPAGLSSFAFNPAANAYCYTSPHNGEILTLIPTVSGDFVIDHGANRGAGFAVRQAAAKEWQAAYNGNYLIMVYDVRDGGSSVKAMKLVLSGNGNCQVFDPSSAVPSAPVFTGSFTSFEDFNGGPDGSKFTTLVREHSGCDNAVSDAIKASYNLHGGFISPRNENGDCDVVIMLDPLGRYCYFTTWTSLDRFQYGYGIKDEP
jgi:hypothetical protein